MIVKELSVNVSYRVGLGDIDIPDHVYNQLQEVFEMGGKINPCDINDDYQDTADWLNANIKERDACDWEVEIEELTDETENG